MIYSVDKAKGLLKAAGEFVHVKLTSHPEGYGIKLTNSEGVVSADRALYSGAYMVCEDLPMSASVLKRVLNKRGPVKFLTSEGVVDSYVKATNNNSGITSSGVSIEITSPVYLYTDSNKEMLQKAAVRNERKVQWIKSKGIGKLITYGFELETQSTMGHTPRTIKDQQIPVNKLQTTIESLRDYIQDDRLGRSIQSLDSTKFVQVVEMLGVNNVFASLPHKYFMPFSDKIDVCTDGSVDGFEIKTIGGLDESQLGERLADVFQVEHKIDHRCSFHIHVGSSGMELPKRSDQIGAMTDYIRKHPLLPQTVKDRLTNVKSNYFCRVNLKDPTSKNSFIRVHPQGTLEFRCFGNIQNQEQAATCFKIVEEAILIGLANTKSYSQEWAANLASQMQKGASICA